MISTTPVSQRRKTPATTISTNTRCKRTLSAYQANTRLVLTGRRRRRRLRVDISYHLFNTNSDLKTAPVTIIMPTIPSRDEMRKRAEASIEAQTMEPEFLMVGVDTQRWGAARMRNFL